MMPAYLSHEKKRQPKYFKTRAAAVEFADKLKLSFRGSQVDVHTTLSSSEHEELSSILAEIAPYGVTLREIVDYYKLRNNPQLNHFVSDAVLKYLDTIADKSKDHISRVRQILGRLAEDFPKGRLDDFSLSSLESWLSGWKLTATSYNHGVRILKPFFKWAMAMKFCATNPVENMSLRNQSYGEIQTLTINEAQRLVNACIDYRQRLDLPSLHRLDCRSFLPCIAVMLFAGVRPKEVTRITWDDIKLDKRLIHVSPEASKTRSRRLIHIEDNLMEILQSIPEVERKGTIAGTNYKRKWTLIRQLCEISDMNDVCRHSYASYWLAVHHDLNVLQKYMGHTTKDTTLQWYLQAQTHEDGLEYFSIKPNK